MICEVTTDIPVFKLKPILIKDYTKFTNMSNDILKSIGII